MATRTTTRKTTKNSTKAASDILGFKASDHTPASPFEVSTAIPSITEAERDNRLKAIDGQGHALEVAAANAEVAKQAYAVEAKVASAQIAQTKALTAWEKLAQEQQRLSIEQTKGQALQHELGAAQDYVQNAATSRSLAAEGYTLKQQGLRADNTHTKAMLTLQAEHNRLQLNQAKESMNRKFAELKAAQ